MQTWLLDSSPRKIISDLLHIDFRMSMEVLSANVLQKKIGVQSVDDIPDQFLLQEYGNDLSRKLS